MHNAKRTMILDHMKRCIGDEVAEDGRPAEDALHEFKTLAKYL
ncbi:hypothetical protein [Fulvimarina pelagi]|nr:hypothetical protein [Fulvimarina pelagi]